MMYFMCAFILAAPATVFAISIDDNARVIRREIQTKGEIDIENKRGGSIQLNAGGEMMYLEGQPNKALFRSHTASRVLNAKGAADAFHPETSFGKESSSVCDFTADQSIWALYMKSPKHGVLLFQGNECGQGVGNVFGGLANAVMLAVASGRELVVDYPVGGVQLSDVIPANKVGPSWKFRAVGGCSARTEDFNFQKGSRTPAEDIVKMAMNVTKYPVLCHEGNFGFGILQLLQQSHSSDTISMSCALNFVLDTASFMGDLVPGTFNFVGHLRLGDHHMVDGKDTSDGRPILNNPEWGIHDVNSIGSKFVECMQGVAKSVSKDRACTITVLSDSSEVKTKVSALTNKQPCDVKVSPGTPKHSAHSQFSSADAKSMFEDLFALSNADATMLTYSAFGQVGASMQLSPHPAFEFEDFMAHYHKQQVGGLMQMENTLEESCYSFAAEGKGMFSIGKSLARYLEMVERSPFLSFTKGMKECRQHRSI